MTSLQLIQHYYHSFNQQNWPAMLACLDPNVRHDANQGDSHFGIENFRLFLEKMEAAYSEKLTDFTFLSNEKGDRIAAEFTVHGTYKKADEGLPPARGQKYELPVGAFFEVKNGKICRVTTYYNLPKWLEMVG